MIILKVFGGLGNQLFQYAFGRAISLKYDRELVIDKSYFDEKNYPFQLHPYYPYKLDDYENISSFFYPKQKARFAKLIARKKIYKLSNLFSLLAGSPYFLHEREFNFSKLEGHKIAYLKGYWQKFRLIEEFRSEILEDLSFNKPLTEENNAYLVQIKSANSVSIHIRRGDYMNHPVFKGLYSNCSLDYFKRGAQEISNTLNDPLFFIFSNDNNWVRENFEIPFKTILIDCDGPDHEHLFLMSQCKHNIISNSTFSWWGAWMNDNPEKVVIGPKNWFQDEKRKDDIYYPKAWKEMDNG